MVKRIFFEILLILIMVKVLELAQGLGLPKVTESVSVLVQVSEQEFLMELGLARELVMVSAMLSELSKALEPEIPRQ